MANFVKYRIGVSLFSLSMLVLIPLLESKFNAPVTIKRWCQLTWDDFRGIPQPFSSYGAVISSNVYLEYDSSTARYNAYAGQNDIHSWTKGGQSDYALNHEQYHFNISELHARLLNKYIIDNPGKSEHWYQLQLEMFRSDLDLMQDRYDRETDHSTIFDRQRRWEYQIDSLLRSDSGWVTDQFSGARVFFPTKPETSKGKVSDEIWYRRYSLSKYGTYFSITSYQLRSLEIDALIANLKDIYTRDQYVLKSLKVDSVDFPLEIMVFSRDTANRSHINRWIYNYDYLYQIGANYPGDVEDTTGYFQIATSFINSLSVENTNNFWFDEREKSEAPILRATIASVSMKDDKKGECLWRGNSTQRGLFRGPFFRDDGALFLAFDAIEHNDSLLLENAMIIENGLYTFQPEATGQLFFIPEDQLPKDDTFNIEFGYFLKNDSARCKVFYYQTLPVKVK